MTANADKVRKYILPGRIICIKCGQALMPEMMDKNVKSCQGARKPV